MKAIPSQADAAVSPLKRGYLSLQEAFEKAIALEVMLAQRKSEALSAQGATPCEASLPGHR